MRPPSYLASLIASSLILALGIPEISVLAMREAIAEERVSRTTESLFKEIVINSFQFGFFDSIELDDKDLIPLIKVGQHEQEISFYQDALDMSKSAGDVTIGALHPVHSI